MEWSSFGIGVMISVIATGIVSLIAWSKGVVAFEWASFLRSVKLQKRLRSAGLSNFYASRSDFVRYRKAPKLTDFLSLAEKSIDIAAYWMAHGNEAEGIAEHIAKLVQPPKKIRATVAIIDPKSVYIEELACYLDMKPSELKSRIESSLNNLYEAKRKLSAEDQKRFKIKIYHTIPIASVIMIDEGSEDGRIQLDFKPYKVPRDYSFAFQFSGRGKYLYDLCRNAWKRLIDDANEYAPPEKLIDSV